MARSIHRLLAALATFAAVAGCTLPGDSGLTPASAPGARYTPTAPGRAGGVMVFSDWEYPDTLDIIAAAAETDLRAAGLVFSPLWGLDPALRPYPDLVSEVPSVENGDVRIGADGRSMTVDLKLVHGLRWSDGQPLTADDVIFTWKAICDPAVQAPSTAGFDRVDSMTRVSDSEVMVAFAPEPRGHCGAAADIPSGVYGAYLQMGPVWWVMPAHRLSGIPGGQWAADPFFQKPDVASGPFIASEAIADDHITFVPNPHYADGRSAAGAYTGAGGRLPFAHAPYLSRLVFRAYPSHDAMLAGLRAGATDIGFHLAAEDVRGLRSFAGSAPVVYTGLRDEFLNPNHDVNTATGHAPPWVGDPPVLDALTKALDPPALAAAATSGAGEVAAGLFPRAMADPGGRRPAAARRDLDGARRILEADGWAAQGDGVRAKAGRRLAFSLYGICDDGAEATLLGVVRQQLHDAGMDAQTECRQRAPFFASFRDGGINATGAFDLSLYSNAWAPDPSAWSEVGVSSGIPGDQQPAGQNWNRCRSAAIDSNFARGDGSADAATRGEAYAKGEAAWLEYHCTIPLFDTPSVRQVATRVHNFFPDPGIQMDTWNAADWWI